MTLTSENQILFSKNKELKRENSQLSEEIQRLINENDKLKSENTRFKNISLKSDEKNKEKSLDKSKKIKKDTDKSQKTRKGLSLFKPKTSKIVKEEKEKEREKRVFYNFQINHDPITKIEFKESTTIGNVILEIAKKESQNMGDNVNPENVSILFAGKVLRKEITLKNLNLMENDILQVLILSDEDILLQPAKALRVLPQGDNISEYEYEYEYEYDDDDE